MEPVAIFDLLTSGVAPSGLLVAETYHVLEGLLKLLPFAGIEFHFQVQIEFLFYILDLVAEMPKQPFVVDLVGLFYCLHTEIVTE